MQNKVSRATVGATTVTATVFSQSMSVQIVVCAVSSLSSDACEVEGGEHAVSAWSESGGDVTVTANMNTGGVDVSAVYDELIHWSGGRRVADAPNKRTVSRGNPTQEQLKAECGISNDTLTVWVIKANIDISGVSDSEEDTKDAKLYANTDDDNCSATVEPPDDGSDWDESAVNSDSQSPPRTTSSASASASNRPDCRQAASPSAPIPRDPTAANFPVNWVST